ncbi:Hypothetical_protein [Hexamita inflata]|uniref:Hypothetical_protein n=1 Tax=Hexamita inflata TaxID=28002 RepID=A0AA86V060_9EUKA|nr:Hypothetical protein HINF_LOCUS62954 [Hexamita inflata]
MSVLMRRENTLIIEPGSDISKIQIINFILLPNSKKHFEGPPLQVIQNHFFRINLWSRISKQFKTEIQIKIKMLQLEILFRFTYSSKSNEESLKCDDQKKDDQYRRN